MAKTTTKEWLDQIEGDLFKTRELEPTAKEMFGRMVYSALLSIKEDALAGPEQVRWNSLNNYVIDFFFDGTDPKL